MTSTSTTTPIVAVTEAAAAFVLGMRSSEPDGDGLALRVDVIGITSDGRDYTYELSFEPLEGAPASDELRLLGELPVLVPGDDVDELRGATLDHDERSGLLIRNPNRPSPTIARGDLVLEGTLGERLQQLVDGEINPSLAMHGGFVRVDRIEDDIAYVVMGGGCQGCGLAKLTLTEGIKATIEDRIPEISQVVDVTDHAAGDNPFFEPTDK